MKTEANGQLLLFEPEIKATPPLKWVGGKGKIADLIVGSIPKTCTKYYEPFLGGASVLLEAIALRPQLKFAVSDINSELINCYKVIIGEPKQLYNNLQSCVYNKTFFERVRSWDREENWKEKYTPIERAMRFIVINKWGFNGLQRVNSQGFNNVSFGRTSSGKVAALAKLENLLAFSKSMRSVDLRCGSWEECIVNVGERSFVYFDPPYDETFSKYSGSFDKSSQIRLAEKYMELSDRGVYVMASNSDTPMIRSLYRGFNIKEIKMGRSISCDGKKRQSVVELLISNF